MNPRESALIRRIRARQLKGPPRWRSGVSLRVRGGKLHCAVLRCACFNSLALRCTLHTPERSCVFHQVCLAPVNRNRNHYSCSRSATETRRIVPISLHVTMARLLRTASTAASSEAVHRNRLLKTTMASKLEPETRRKAARQSMRGLLAASVHRCGYLHHSSLQCCAFPFQVQPCERCLLCLLPSLRSHCPCFALFPLPLLRRLPTPPTTPPSPSSLHPQPQFSPSVQSTHPARTKRRRHHVIQPSSTSIAPGPVHDPATCMWSSASRFRLRECALTLPPRPPPFPFDGLLLPRPRRS